MALFGAIRAWELLGRELGTHWADLGIVEPNPNRTMALVRSASAIPLDCRPGLSGNIGLILTHCGLRWTPFVRQPEPLLRCSPAGFDVGSDHCRCSGWRNAFAFSKHQYESLC